MYSACRDLELMPRAVFGTVGIAKLGRGGLCGRFG
jgi:hypothetical protein